MTLSACGPVFTDRQGKELIEHGTPLFPVACYHDSLEEEPIPWHWHDEMEILTVEEGITWVSVNGEEHRVARGEGFFLNTGSLHRIRREGNTACVLRSVVFHPRLVGGSVDSILWQKYLEPLLSQQRLPYVYFSGAQEWERAAVEAIQAAWRACASETEGFEFLVRDRLSHFIFLLSKNYPTAEKAPSEKVLRDGERIKAMLQYIQGNYSGELTLAGIAQSAAVSESECLRCFRSMTGSSPIQYVKQVRIQKAAELLAATDWKISDIGAACGFQEMSYFAKSFRELKGSTPSQYRQLHAG